MKDFVIYWGEAPSAQKPRRLIVVGDLIVRHYVVRRAGHRLAKWNALPLPQTGNWFGAHS